MFVDDTALYAHSFSVNVANEQVQIHVDQSKLYWDRCNVKTNATKSESVIFARKSRYTKVFTPIKSAITKSIHQTRLDILECI